MIGGDRVLRLIPMTSTPPRSSAGRTRAVLLRAARFPFTAALTAALLLVAVLTGTHLTPLSHLPWYDTVATGLPALRHGRWWTLVTAPWFVTHPLRFLLALPLTIGAVGWAEARFGSLRTAGLFAAGHLVGALGGAATIAIAAARGGPWAVGVSHALGVGPTSGALACLVFAVATLPSPWRLRARFAIGAWAAIGLIYLGHLVNVERVVVFLAALAVSGALPAYRHPAGRPTIREWRLLGFAWLIVIGVVEVFNLIPFNGPIGRNSPFLPAGDVLLDLTVIALVAHGVRLGIRAAWIGTLVLAGVNVLTALALGPLVPALEGTGLIDGADDLLRLVVPSAVLWAVQGGIMLLGRGAFQVPLRRSRRGLGSRVLDPDAAKERLRRIGGGSISWMIGWPDNRQIEVATGVLAFQSHAGVAIALGDPVVPAKDLGIALREFAHASEQAGFVPCVFSASSAAAAARPAGWRYTVIAEDTIVDLPGLSLSGKRWNSVRTSLNKAAREGVEFRLCTLADEPRSVLAQVRAISEQWTGDRGLPEMRFTLGTVDEALDPEVRVGLAADADGNLHGITSWLPVYGPPDAADSRDPRPRVRGWTLDLMRRREDGFGPVMEFLIGAAALRFKEEGYEFLSLSGAPLVRPEQRDPAPVDRVLDGLGELLEPLYGFRSLHRFKQKFHPRSEPLHLLYRDEGDLPRIAIALTRAYLPDASLRELVGSASGARA